MVETDEADVIVRKKCSVCSGDCYITEEVVLTDRRGRLLGKKTKRTGCEACGWSGYEGGLPLREEMTPDEAEAAEHWVRSVASAMDRVYKELHPER